MNRREANSTKSNSSNSNIPEIAMRESDERIDTSTTSNFEACGSDAMSQDFSRMVQQHKRSNCFPIGLFIMLTKVEHVGLDNVVSWVRLSSDKLPKSMPLNHNLRPSKMYAFRVHDMNRFENEVLPMFFKTRRYKVRSLLRCCCSFETTR